MERKGSSCLDMQGPGHVGVVGAQTLYGDPLWLPPQTGRIRQSEGKKWSQSHLILLISS